MNALGSTLAAGMAVLLLQRAARADDEQTAVVLEPERIDVVFSRLARQDRTLQTLLEIVEKLETVAEHPNAAAALLSDEGEPTDRLRSALVEVAKHRRRPLESPARPAVRDTAIGPTESLRPEIAYAQMTPGGAPRVLLSVRGVRFDATEGRSIRFGEDRIHVRAIRRRRDGGVEVELSVNGGPPFVRRTGR